MLVMILLFTLPHLLTALAALMTTVLPLINYRLLRRFENFLDSHHVLPTIPATDIFNVIDRPIPNVSHIFTLIIKLRESKVNIKFVTNTTKESRKFLHERLTKLGFDLQPEEIFTSLHAARDLLRQEQCKPMLMIDPAAWEDFTEFKNVTDEEINAVVIGLAPSEFHYDQLNKAFRYIMNGAKLIAVHEARYFKQSDGLSLGPGAFVKGLEYSTDTKATVVGKPTASFFKRAAGDVDPNYAVMIGDDVRDDVGGAQQCGMKGFLVQTGKYREGDETKISPPPFAVCKNFSEAVDKILAIINS